MVVGFNFVVCILALIMLGSFLFRSKKVDSLFIMFSIMVGVNCFGRYMLSVSESLRSLWDSILIRNLERYLCRADQNWRTYITSFWKNNIIQLKEVSPRYL